MNPENEEFQQLRRLLALKRHEQPPPGFFHNFSGQVIARIKAGERGDRTLDRSWLQKFFGILEARPIYAGAFGAAVCAILVSGILNSEEGGALTTNSIIPAATPALGRVTEGSAPTLVTAINDIKDSQTDAGTNLNSLDSLFNSQPNVQPVSGSLVLPGGGY